MAASVCCSQFGFLCFIHVINMVCHCALKSSSFLELHFYFLFVWRHFLSRLQHLRLFVLYSNSTLILKENKNYDTALEVSWWFWIIKKNQILFFSIQVIRKLMYRNLYEFSPLLLILWSNFHPKILQTLSYIFLHSEF